MLTRVEIVPMAHHTNVEWTGEEVADAFPRPAARVGPPTWRISGLVQDPGHFGIAVLAGRISLEGQGHGR